MGTLEPHARERKETVINLNVFYSNARSVGSKDWQKNETRVVGLRSQREIGY